MTDYDEEFQNCESACGESFEEMVGFFSETSRSRLRVLDLGCGQGRDALMAARYGHQVLGVDLSPTGIRQMISKAEIEELDVQGEVVNICEFNTSEKFDIVILDRVIHMLDSTEDKSGVLDTATACISGGGFVLLVDIPENLPLIEAHFNSMNNWESRFCRRGFRFYQKSEDDKQ